MNILKTIKNRLISFPKTFERFPVPLIFLVVIAVCNAVLIETNKFTFLKTDIQDIILAAIVGFMLSLLAQTLYERISNCIDKKIKYYAVSILFTFGYFLLIRDKNLPSNEIEIKTAIAIFALLLVFLWLPSFKSKITFNTTFYIAIKSFFISFMFSAVIMLGLSLIYMAIDQLIFSLNENIYIHTANIIFVLFAVIYFLSLIPIYPNKQEFIDNSNNLKSKIELIEKEAKYPKIIEILISYIIVPLSMIFTLILILYIGINITSEFWVDERLETMLVSYIVAIIVIYILESNIENKMTNIFKKLLPKVLILIAIFQTANSILKIEEYGVTIGRYYVIIFGVFAVIASVIFSFKKPRANGIIVIILVVFIGISLMPVINAFNVSEKSQIYMFEKILNENQMIKDNKVVANSKISSKDQKRIIEIIEYMDYMQYLNKVKVLPKSFDPEEDFEKTFGFGYEEYDEKEIFIQRENPKVIETKDFDYAVYLYMDNLNNSDFEHKIGKNNYLIKKTKNEVDKISLLNNEKEEILSISTEDLRIKFNEISDKYEDLNEITEEERKIEVTNGEAKMVFIIDDLEKIERHILANGYLLIKIK